MHTQENTAPIEQSWWLEPDDFHKMWGPFETEEAAESERKKLQADGGSYTSAIRLVRARTRLYPQDWQGQHSQSYLTKLDDLDGAGAEEGE